ncbi:MAG TPA: transcriptional regulator [Gammaproteobacteria bacterium]|nr:transcriptional regulator [Gammaproteobacteria bacterium]MEC8010538.1 helix-turn-helix transcriptional regulator [Pseudomonadota bacterium]HCK94289.1 transcriptional regulator [Gammaproteobacteria bacterium]|tara:strand:- start:348 stop:659 length:312 start_codon:yes stop_codon:yes gene_type:complete
MPLLLEQIKNRRKALGLTQEDMMLRAGISRQQYQRIESKGNPRLDTMELIAKGLKSELVLIPYEKRTAVMALLAQDDKAPNEAAENAQAISDDPWRGLLGDEE